MAGFGVRHGEVSTCATDSGVRVVAADGATADLISPLAGWVSPDSGDLVSALVAFLLAPRRLAVLVVRRGGFACAVVADSSVVVSKVGHRHVQGRTAAGGWSQQRFARRREKQTAELVDAAADLAARLLVPALPVSGLVTGGDRPLVDQVLADRRLAGLAGVVRAAHLPVGDPRADVVKALPGMLRTVTITLREPS